jgi:hypothetical protein
MKSRRMRWAGNLAYMGEEIKVYRVLVGKPKGKMGGCDQNGSWGDWLEGC